MPISFTNQASLTIGNETTLSNVAVGEITEILSATKDALMSEYKFGDTVTYIINLINSGSTELTNLTLTDNLGAYEFNSETLIPLTYVENSVKYYVNGVLQTPPTINYNIELVSSDLNIPANGNATIIYQATINEYAPLESGSTITNQVSVTGQTITNITAEETINASNTPALSILKTITPYPVEENGQVTYTLLIQNFGNTAVTGDSNAVISDTFTPIISNLSASLNGSPLTQTTDYTYSELTGIFNTVAGIVTVPAATYTQDQTTGEYNVTPGTATLVISGTI